MAVSGHHLGGQLCEALGLKECVSLSIHCGGDATAYVDATLLVPSESGNGLVEVMKRYMLTEAAPEEDDEPGGDIDWGDGGPLDAK